MLNKLNGYFTRSEKLLWGLSILFIILSFLIFDRSNYVTLAASLIGVSALIFCAKGNPIGQGLMIIFCVIYAIISLSFRYYGEMMTYLGMSLPMAVLSLISWITHPYAGRRSEVKINTIKRKELIFIFFLSAVVTFIFYFILDYFDTANLIPSTISITTSFIAAYLTFRRSPYFALAYASNDVVLIVMWILAAISDSSYFSVIICFIVFLFNDLYGFINWNRMKKKQSYG